MIWARRFFLLGQPLVIGRTDYKYVHTYIHIDMYTYKFMCLHTCIYIYIDVHMFASGPQSVSKQLRFLEQASAPAKKLDRPAWPAVDPTGWNNADLRCILEPRPPFNLPEPDFAVYTYTFFFVCICICIHTYIYICMQLYMYVYLYIVVSLDNYMPVYIYIYSCTCTYVRICIICLFSCAFVFIHIGFVSVRGFPALRVSGGLCCH